MKLQKQLASSTIQTRQLLCLESVPFQLHWWCVFTTTLCTTMERTSNCVFILLPRGFDWAPHLASLCTGQWSVYLTDSLSNLTWCFNEHTLALCYSIRADMHNPGLSSMRQCYQLLLAPSAHVSSVESLKKGADKQTAPLRHAQRGKSLCSVHWSRQTFPHREHTGEIQQQLSPFDSFLYVFWYTYIVRKIWNVGSISGQNNPANHSETMPSLSIHMGKRECARCLCSRCFL